MLDQLPESLVRKALEASIRQIAENAGVEGSIVVGRIKRKATERAKEIALQEAYRLVPVREGDKIVKMPAIEAVHRSQIALAAKGNGPAQRAVLRCSGDREGRPRSQHGGSTSCHWYKAMAEREAERRRRLGITYVDPNAPHPDDLVIDMHTGDVAMCHKDFAPLVRPRK